MAGIERVVNKMAALLYMMGNLKKRKSYSVVICILVFLSGLILTATVSTTQNTAGAYDKAYNNMKGPHLMYWLEENTYRPEFKQWFEEQAGVSSVKLVKERYYYGSVLEHNGTVIRNSIALRMLQYDPSDNMKLVNGIYPPGKMLSKGEIYLPYVYMAANGLSAGDEVDLRLGAQKMHFRITGFLEDPIYGGELVAGKFLFISDEDFAELSDIGAGKISRDLQIRVRFNDYNEFIVNEMSKKFTSEFNLNTGRVFTFGEIKNWHLTLPKISLVVMIAFVMMLSIITVTIMRYAILATIEADFTNIGIIKALGFTPFMVQAAITGQYALLALVSGILSIIAGIFITPVLGGIILKSSGLYYNGRFSALVGILALTSIILVISVFSYITAGHTRKISPIRAISQGIAPVYFTSRVNIKLEKMGFVPFNIRMAVKQVLTKSKRYILLLFISALLVYALVFLLGFVQMFNSEKAINMLGGELSDIRITTLDKASAEKLISKIKSDYDVAWATYQTTAQLDIDGTRTIVRVKDDFDSTGELTTLSGRHPRHDNEVAISDLLKSKFNKGIGDSLSIKDKSGTEHQFIITGIFQTIDEGGSYARMLESGMKTLDPEYQMNVAYIKLKSHNNLDNIISEIKKKYTGFEEISNERKQSSDRISTIQTVFSGISKLVFILTIVIISFITLLIMKITVYSETRELGIFKAIGFSSARLRLQLALRFVIVTVAGGLAGVVLETMFGAKLFTLALKSFGLSSFKIEFSLINALIPITAISILSILSAYISSGNTKKVSVYALINE